MNADQRIACVIICMLIGMGIAVLFKLSHPNNLVLAIIYFICILSPVMMYRQASKFSQMKKERFK